MNLAILSVIYNNHNLFELNFDLISSLNKDLNIRFFIIDNSNYTVDNFKESIFCNSNVVYYKNDFNPKIEFKMNSYHHAYALDFGINLIKNESKNFDYFLVIDPDLYIFGDNYLTEYMTRMSKMDIQIFGIPWALKWKNKYKNFPCVHFMLLKIDLISDLPSFEPISKNRFLMFNLIKYLQKNKYLNHLSSFVFDHVPDTGSELFLFLKNKKTVVFKETEYKKLKEFARKNLFDIKYPKLISLLFDNNTTVEVFSYENTIAAHLRCHGNRLL
jgi:hypothetical protein